LIFQGFSSSLKWRFQAFKSCFNADILLFLATF
jgi:hypothetical protein